MVCENTFHVCGVLPDPTTDSQPVPGNVPCQKTDISYAVSSTSSMTDEETYAIIQHRCPDDNCELPSKMCTDSRRKSGQTKRQLSREVFNEFSFAAFSPHQQGTFCTACVLFPTSPENPGATRAKILISQPLTNIAKTKELLNNHASLKYHKKSMAKLHAFSTTYKVPSQRIDCRLSDRLQALVRHNRTILKSILKSLLLCARQGIALRGHRDDSTSESLNKGSFLAVINFRRELDHVLDEHLRCGQRNATMVSKTVQNDLLDQMGQYVIKKVCNDVAASPYLAVMADEVSDVSNWEQLGVAVRYIKNNTAHEKMLLFSQVDQIDGKSICQALIDAFTKELGIDLSACRAQANDGAGNIAGRLRGCQALFQDTYPLAGYYHCASHQLNLAITKSSTLMEVQLAHETIKSVGLFFEYSPKRQRQLEAAIKDENSRRTEADGQDSAIPLKKIGVLCDTRWVERHTTLDDFHTLYEPLMDCLDTIIHSGNYDSKAVTEANGMLTANVWEVPCSILRCPLCVIFLVDLSRLLQGSSQDIIVAYDEVSLIRDQFRDVRRQATEEFKALFKTMVDTHGEETFAIPRRCRRQTMRANVPATEPEDYWRMTVFVPYLDHIGAELDARFSAMNATAVKGFHLLPVNCAAAQPVSSATLSTDLTEGFRSDLPSPERLQAEVDRWQTEMEIGKGRSCATDNHFRHTTGV